MFTVLLGMVLDALTPVGMVIVMLYLRTIRANHRSVIGSSITGVGLEPTIPAL